ncbi:uncharacterized protein L969DRAFT_96917 [Mixia osmundae IAM 14324]|uniref:Uncharacterized protein n=1 Tax=Mixia osmundae (strain CBS 9802 / IAM 14324 / JCM 22182 / KY 12970) TaxID=764103 RepID=G7E2H0_MIXOS|nr:uncharacterized protein L969DRAFT_96917 [Mixia osmundae IAM 14324]KEI36901.1 hypothetical protein L969DRAFT_96917 [Mixia osmundae IAM 14324]GAA97030.1 hypothetical protein E5Q_03705 [Mixia osmundae IAM 14324]
MRRTIILFNAAGLQICICLWDNAWHVKRLRSLCTMTCVCGSSGRCSVFLFRLFGDPLAFLCSPFGARIRVCLERPLACWGCAILWLCFASFEEFYVGLQASFESREKEASRSRASLGLISRASCSTTLTGAASMLVANVNYSAPTTFLASKPRRARPTLDTQRAEPVLAHTPLLQPASSAVTQAERTQLFFDCFICPILSRGQSAPE